MVCLDQSDSQESSRQGSPFYTMFAFSACHSISDAFQLQLRFKSLHSTCISTLPFFPNDHPEKRPSIRGAHYWHHDNALMLSSFPWFGWGLKHRPLLRLSIMGMSGFQIRVPHERSMVWISPPCSKSSLTGHNRATYNSPSW